MDRDPEYERLHALIAEVEAPLSLRERITAEQERHRNRGMVVKRLKLTGAMAGVAAALGIALALVAPSGNAPGANQVAALAGRGPTAGAPASIPADPQQLRASVDGVAFPQWSQRYHWRASGRRSDTVGGRQAVTVFYDNPQGVRLGYTIVSGHALGWSAGSRVVVNNGVEVHVHRGGDRVVAEWREHGHTCVISAPSSVSDATMVLLASHDYAA